MPHVHDDVNDAPLNVLEAGFDRLYLCSADPTTYVEATATFMIGYKENPVITGPVDRPTGGRQITVEAITGGLVVNTGTATHWAIVDEANQKLLSHRSLGAPVALVFGTAFETAEFTIGMADPE